MNASEALEVLNNNKPDRLNDEYNLIIETILSSAKKGYNYINFRIRYPETIERLTKDGYVVTNSNNAGYTGRRGHKISIPTNLD